MNQDDLYAIHQAKSEIREGYCTGDVDRIVRQYADGYGDIGFGMPGLDGEEPKTVLRARLQHLFQHHTAELVPVVYNVSLCGDLAFARGLHVLTLHAKVGEEAQVLRTRFVESWQRQRDGAWQIAYVLDNKDVPPMMVDDVLTKVRAGDFNEATRSMR